MSSASGQFISSVKRINAVVSDVLSAGPFSHSTNVAGLASFRKSPRTFSATADALSSRSNVQNIVYPFFVCRFRNLTPGPPPFSSMNSTPADSNALLRPATVDIWAAIIPGFDSRRFIVGSDTDEAFAKSRCSQRNRARAARINSLLRRSSAFPMSAPIGI